jgi:hypothetical protein
MSNEILHKAKASDLWGVGRERVARKRGDKARARRSAKRAAKRAKTPLKAWLRAHGGAS